jgi:hypothetical protein
LTAKKTEAENRKLEKEIQELRLETQVSAEQREIYLKAKEEEIQNLIIERDALKENSIHFQRIHKERIEKYEIIEKHLSSKGFNSVQELELYYEIAIYVMIGGCKRMLL